MHVADTGIDGVLARKREHLVSHVEPEGDPGRADALRRQDHVDATRAEVEHRLALAQLRHGSRVAAAKAGERRRLGQLAALLRVVERLTEHARVALIGAARPAPATALADLSFGDSAGRLGVAAP